MIKGGVFLLLCLLGSSVWAQTDMEQMFQENNPNIIYKDEARSFDGNPLVYIEGVSDKPQPKNWKDRLKIKLFGSMDIPNKDLSPELETAPTEFDNGNKNIVEIQPAFGPKRQEAFVPHTADWRFIITSSDTQTLNVQEEMIFILNEDKKELVKDWPIAKEKFQLLEVRLDGRSLPTKIQEEKESVFLTLPQLKTGTHKLHFNYLLLNTFNQKQLTIPLIGKRWELLSNGFSGVILANPFYNVNQLKFLVGTNNQEFPENFTLKQDTKNNTYFGMNKILPLKTQIQLVGEADKILDKSIFNVSLDSVVFFVALGILILYFFLSNLEIKKMALEKKLKKFRHQSENFFIRWLFRMIELIIGTALLLILTKVFCCVFEIQMSWIQWGILMGISFVVLILSDIFVFTPEQKAIQIIHQNQQKRSLL